MEQKELLETITHYYLNSPDFNGISLTNIGLNLDEIKILLKGLLEKGEINLNFGDRHPNPYILAFEPEPIEEQLLKLNKLNFQEPLAEQNDYFILNDNKITCCVYPSKQYLAKIVNPNDYLDKPYTLLLALGEPQLAFRSFNLRVLEFYRNDPRYYYDTDDISGIIYTKTNSGVVEHDQVFLQSFGFAYDKNLENRFLAAFLIDLTKLTSEHQKRWKLEEHIGETILHPEFARESAGEWLEKESIFVGFCEEIKIINEMAKAITGIYLFQFTYDRSTKPKKFGFLIRPTREEYNDFILLLDKMISDNFNRGFFKVKIELIDKDGKEKGTITLLDEWLNMSVRFPDPEPKNKMIRVFKEIRQERNEPAHKETEDEWDDKYFIKQKEMMIKAYEAIRTLRLILANHPSARVIKVPDWLYKGDIIVY